MCDFGRRIMILGGSPPNQRMRANALLHGFYVIACVPLGCGKDTTDADIVYEANPTEFEKILKIAQKEKIDGIASNRDDYMKATAYVSEKMGLMGNSVDSVDKLQNKYRFRMLQKECGVYCPDFELLKSNDDIFEKIKKFSYPLIMKPCESAGSRGVKRFDAFSRDEILNNYETCRNFSRNQEVMIEGYVSRGLTNLECDIFVHEGKILYIGYETNICAPEKPMQPRGGMFPADVSVEQKAKFESAVSKIIEKSGIRHGMYNIEALFTEKGEVFIVEINARMAGATVPEVIKRYCGIDVYYMLISTSVGDDTYFDEICVSEFKENFVTSFELFPWEDGIFSGVYIADEIKKYVYDTKIWGEIGKTVSKTSNSSNSLGKVYLEYPTRKEQLETLLMLDKYIYPILK
ncbi:MAG: ATP-grasp domain-containing protein [Clostridiales bacterium]|nr:ATP-grasp domain-containing protein [Candidatus Equinaster intestinalis]